MFTVEELLLRARSALELGTLYWLGSGGTDPHAPRPASPLAVAREWQRLPEAQREELAPLARAMDIDVHDPHLVVDACDCSGYVCWALGIPRHVGAAVFPGNGGWINTDSIWADAMGPQRFFARIDRARPGALLVYPRDGSPHDIGHIGIVTGVDDDGRATQVAHCSAANVKAPPHDAVKITGVDAFGQSGKIIHAWYGGGLEPTGSL